MTACIWTSVRLVCEQQKVHVCTTSDLELQCAVYREKQLRMSEALLCLRPLCLEVEVALFCKRGGNQGGGGGEGVCTNEVLTGFVYYTVNTAQL